MEPGVTSTVPQKSSFLRYDRGRDRDGDCWGIAAVTQMPTCYVHIYPTQHRIDTFKRCSADIFYTFLGNKEEKQLFNIHLFQFEKNSSTVFGSST